MSDTSARPTYSEPGYAASVKPKSAYPWYLENIDKYNSAETQQLLKTYSGIPLEEQSKHIHDIRDKAWAIRAYPCTGLGVWLTPYIACNPAYQAVVDKLKNGATLLDIGCFVGMDLRRLVYDGAPSDKMYGVDIVSHWEVGYELFRDKDRYAGHFIESDFLSTDNASLTALHGKIDIVSISAVLHQWAWDKQVEAAKRLVAFTSKPGALVLGYQIGSLEAGEITRKGINVPTYRHDADSFARLWDQVGKETGTKWETKARLLWWTEVGWYPEDQKWMLESDRVLDFVVTRLE